MTTNKVSPSRTSSFNPKSSIGVGGSVIFGGFIQDNEKLQKLRGAEKYTTFSNYLANVPVIAAGVRYFLNLVSKSTWRVESVDDTPAAKEMAERLEEVMWNTESPWHRIVRRASMYKFYGFSVQEWTARVSKEGYIDFADIEIRPQSTITRWDVDEKGRVRGLWQTNPQTGSDLYLPRGKLVYLVDDSLNDSPEGLGLLRHVASSAERLKEFESLEMTGFQTDLRGIPIGRAPLSELIRLQNEGALTEEQVRTLKKPIEDFLQNHVRGPKLAMLLDSEPFRAEDEAGTPSGVRQWDVDLLDASVASLKEVAEAIHREVLQIARVLGVEHLLLGADGKGSLALSRDKSNNFALIIDSTLKDLTDYFGLDVINPLWKLNGWDEKLKPWFKTEPIQYRDIEQITGALKDLATAGAVLDPNDDAINEVRDLLGLSHQEELEMEADAGLDRTQGDDEEAMDDEFTDDDVEGDEE